MKHWKLEEILPRLMILVTRHGRHQVKLGVDFEWSKNCWTHNIFRAYEMLFWRRLGKTNNFTDTIRPHYSFEKSENYFKVRFHTIEAGIAHFEGVIRQAFRVRIPEESKNKNIVAKYYDAIRSPYFAQNPIVVQLCFAGLVLTLDSSKIGVFLPMFVGAVAHNGSGGGSDSCSITTSGTNRLLLAAIIANPGSFTYNSVELTQLSTNSTGSPAFFGPTSSYMLAAPDTGTNTLTSSSGNAKMAGSCYTGALQSTPAVEQITIQANGVSITGSLTTDVDNSWVWAGVGDSLSSTGGSQDAGTGSTQRAVSSSGDDNPRCGSYDNGSAKTPVGAVSMTVTFNNQVGTPGMVMAQQQVAPAPTTAIKTFNGLAYASTKTVNGLAVASVKNFNGLA